jgi:hypothetical protein
VYLYNGKYASLPGGHSTDGFGGQIRKGECEKGGKLKEKGRRSDQGKIEVGWVN